MDLRIRDMKFENGARAIGTRTTGGTAYLVSTTKTNALVEFFGKLLRGPLEHKGKPITLKDNEHALIVRHIGNIVNYYVYEKVPLLEEQRLIGEFGVPAEQMGFSR